MTARPANRTLADAKKPQTSATGGSASTQANSSRTNQWASNQFAARTLKFTIFILPILAGYIAGMLFSLVVPRPSIMLGAIAWWFGIIGISTVAIYIVRPAIQGFAPIAFLFQCSLVFPDEAPDRFKVALKQRSARDLQRRIEKGEPLGDTPAEAAENIITLLGLLNDHDRRTRGHSERVRAYTAMIAEQMDLPSEDQDKLHWAALLHDMGKLTVSAEILNKDGRPSKEEWEELRSHPQRSAKFLMPLRPWLGSWLDAATQHHERWDGNGYPRKLAGEQISLAGRIVAVADAYDVMTSARSYKPAWSPAQAREELARCAGTQFDPTVVRAFLNVSSSNLRSVSSGVAWLAHLPKLGEIVGVVGSASTTAGTVATAALTAAVSVAPAVAATYAGPIAVGAVEAQSNESSLELDTPVEIDGASAEPASAEATTTASADDQEFGFELPTVETSPSTTEGASASEIAGSTTSAPTTTTAAAATSTSTPSSTSASTTSTTGAASTTTAASTTSTAPPTTTTTVPPTTTTTTPPTTTTTVPPTTTTVPPTTTTTVPPSGPTGSGFEFFSEGNEPANLSSNEQINNDDVAVFYESNPITLGTNTVLYHGNGATINNGNRTDHEVTVLAGSEVCSTFVHGDPFFPGTFNFTIELGRTVLGVTFKTASLDDTAQFDLPAVNYGGYDGLEGSDWLTVSGGSVSGFFDVQSFLRDHVRIVHEC